MQDKSSYTLGCDTDPEVDSWVTALKKVITSNEMSVGSPLGRTKSRTSIQGNRNNMFLMQGFSENDVAGRLLFIF